MTPPAPNPAYGQHERYYFQGTYVTFLVEDKLFRVPQHRFIRASEVFRDMFSLPQGGASAEGATDAAPIRLPPENVKIADFTALLKLLYPDDIPNVEPSDIAEWESILHLASLWEMDSVRKLATTKLDALLSADEHAVKNILLGKRFENHKWLLRGYEALVRRQESISNEEAIEIGWLSAVGVFRLREAYPPKMPPGVIYPTTCHYCSYSIGNYCRNCGRNSSVQAPSLPVPPKNTIFNAFLDEFKEYKSYDPTLT